MRIIALVTLLFLVFSLSGQTFQVKDPEFIFYMLGITALDLSNNLYVDININKLTEAEMAALDPGQLPFFDKWISCNYDKKLKKASDYTIYGTVAATLLTVYDEDYFWDNLMVYSKILMTQSALCKWVKSLTLRERPYLYDVENKINTKQSRQSFFSSHASTAFASATFAYYYYLDNYGASIPAAALLFGGAVATSCLRVAAAQHFPSDVVTGALMGSLISYCICKVHSTDRIKYNFGYNSLTIGIGF
ncbi:MAG: phosphatase PAP2 family protein [Candidatus Cloacimonetes bacterium]|nr:phosphatase PAP2 family protein [Candidatus Cloacimonadota bacterium]